MRSGEFLERTLEPLGLPVKYFEYAGTKPEYIVYNEEVEQPANYADNRPQNHVTWWQVHIFAPKVSDFRTYKEKAKGLLQEAGFYITDIRTLYEKETKTIHVVICCHIGETEE